MKTTEEVLSDFMLRKELAKANLIDDVIKAMRFYAEQACEEQKKLCVKFYDEKLADADLSEEQIILGTTLPELK